MRAQRYYLAATILVAALSASVGRAAESSHAVDLIEIDGSINPASADYLSSAIQMASRDGAEALVVELDTPGGMLGSARKMVRDILGAPIPVIIYVAPSGASAASAGMFITIAAHIAAMAPGTTIGAAHPVELGGGEVSPVMAQKLENFAVSFAQTVAAQRGRNVKWVEDAVRHSASIGENEAHSQHVVDFVASDLNDLLAKASGHEVSVNGKKRILELKGAAIRQRAMTWRQKLLDLVADPNLVYLLLMGGIVGLYFEFAHPGVFLPGVAGAICLVLALVSFEVLPISTAGFLLLLFGVSLLIAEGFVPTHGVFGIGGVIALVLGSLFLIDKSQTDVTISRSLIAGVGIGFSVVILGIGILVARTRGRPVTTGKEGLIGEIGEVRDPIGPGAPGRVLVHGENWRATSDTTIATGSRAQVVAVRGAKLVVRPV